MEAIAQRVAINPEFLEPIMVWVLNCTDAEAKCYIPSYSHDHQWLMLSPVATRFDS